MTTQHNFLPGQTTFRASEATLDETVAEFLVSLSALYGFNGTGLVRLQAVIPGDALTIPADEALVAASVPQLFDGTTYQRWRTGGSASPLAGSGLVTPVFNPVLITEDTLNDSDKTITVPANTQYRVLAINAEYASTATVGNRLLAVQFRDAADDPFLRINFTVTQAPSLTVFYQLFHNAPKETAVAETLLLHPLPNDLWLLPGFDIRIFDRNAIDTAADDMPVEILVDERSV